MHPRNWAAQHFQPLQALDPIENASTNGPGFPPRSTFLSAASLPDPEVTQEAYTARDHSRPARLATIGSLTQGLLAAVLGAGLGLSFGHDRLGYPACLAVGGFFVLLVKAAGRKGLAFRSAFAAWIGLCFGFGEFFAGMSWFPSSVWREWPQLSVAPEYLLLVYLGSYHALTGALFGAFAQRHRRQGTGWFVAMPIAFACAWTIPEIVRGTAMTGLPILSLGYQMVGTAFFGYAPIAGLYGVGFAAALASSLFGMLVFAKRWRVAAILVMALMADLAGGSLAGSVHWTRPARKPIRVVALQDGIGMSAKSTSVGQVDAIKRYVAWAGAFQGTLLIGSESAIPMPLGMAPPDLLRDLRNNLQAHDNIALLGVKIPGSARSGDSTNSVMAFGAHAPYRYDKRHLVPFAEYTPRGALAEWLGAWVGMTEPGPSSLRPGSPTQANFNVRGASLIPTICYENMFPGLVASSLRDDGRSHVIVNMADMGLFDGTSAIGQNLQITRMLAREFQLPVVLASDTGSTAFIDSDGRVADSLPLIEPGALPAMVSPGHGLTPFAWIMQRLQ